MNFSWLTWADTGKKPRLRVKALASGGPYATSGQKLTYVSSARPSLKVRQGILIAERILTLTEQYDPAIAQFGVAMGFLTRGDEDEWLLPDPGSFQFDAHAFTQLHALWLEFVSNMKRRAAEESP
jgi:predicted outer membrane lipoprotein